MVANEPDISAKAARSVSNALGRNPVPIIILCHRVVRKNNAIARTSR
ncbi:MAG: methylated-DNA--[protein]-cysteine S-methyltransferase [Deltaproteobacteria bacterium]|nr:MAG: methylated-DNA--[protein]-cysteine S-methyltransferase [Deltaproteobacteria bacterium]